MKTKSFLGFVGPSVIVMFTLIALPLAGILYLSLHNSYVKKQLIEVQTEIPLFGGKTRVTTKVVPQPVLGDDGKPVQVWEYVGLQNITNALDWKALADIVSKDRSEQSFGENISSIYSEVINLDFWRALEFTLLYVLLTTPGVIIIGFLLALAVNRVSQGFRGGVIFVTLLPMIITPVVGALSIYWLFLDDAIVSSFLQAIGFGKIYFLKDQLTIRSLIIIFGIWNAAPFAFIILFAGLQTVPQDTLEASITDGANKWQQIRYIVIPHLMPLISLVALIHIMDAYRVFEPILVFGSNLFANSLQYLTYYTLNFEDNAYLAAAFSILTIIGIIFLLTPVLYKVWQEQRGS